VLGDNIFEILDEIAQEYDPTEIVFLMQFYFYYTLCVGAEREDKKKLLREGIAPNPGPSCLTCYRKYGNLELQLCPHCNPQAYLCILEDKSMLRSYKNSVLTIKEAFKHSPTCTLCLKTFSNVISIDTNITTSKKKFFLRLLETLLCSTCYLFFSSTFAICEGR